jgi:hypothetical protein
MVPAILLRRRLRVSILLLVRGRLLIAVTTLWWGWSVALRWVWVGGVLLMRQRRAVAAWVSRLVSRHARSRSRAG